PLLVVAERVTRALLAPLGAAAPLVSGSEEIMGAVELVHREGGVARGERDMVGGLLDLSELAVSDVMVHRTRMRAIDADLPPHEIVREALASPHTRHPLWRGARDNIVGVLHARDLLRALDAAGGDASKVDAATIAAPPWFVPESTDLKTQLEAFLRRKAHFALVVDEYGEVMGLVTLEDILEEIVGDIKDEHDPAVQGVKAQQDGSIMVEGATPIRDVNRAMGWTLPDSEATTMAGLVIHEARAIPEPGQAFTFHGFRFHVLRRTRNRITLLRVAPIRERAKGATAR
ncbi:MAG: CBS domain-containing protein, partial [Hyphomicrobiales bacterium]|nr:CBS domain-containing protein [Hyphomicrobiales bacterium]